MSAGRSVVTLGIVIVVAGLLIEFAPALHLGRLPGDFTFGNQNVRILIPLGTSILISILLTIIVTLISRR